MSYCKQYQKKSSFMAHVYVISCNYADIYNTVSIFNKVHTLDFCSFHPTTLDNFSNKNIPAKKEGKCFSEPTPLKEYIMFRSSH